MDDQVLSLLAPAETYPCDWFLPIGRRGKVLTVPGQVDLDSMALPQGEMFRDIPWFKANRWPQPAIFRPMLEGRLHTNQDVVLLDCRVEAFSPGRVLTLGSYALVGLSVRRVEGQLYKRCRVQLTGLDPLFGTAPLQSTSWPKGRWSRSQGNEVGATTNPGAAQRWRSRDMRITCSYDSRFGVLDHYRFSLRFAPVVTFEAREPLPVADWIDNWLSPLLWLTSLANRQPRQITWAIFEGTYPSLRNPGTTEEATAQLFGAGITQVPYVSDGGFRLRAPRPIVSLKQDRLSLPGLLREWRALARTDNPFVELYRVTMFDQRLPARARFLFLVQALEGLHGYRSRDAEYRRKERHRTRRTKLLEMLKGQPGRLDVAYLEKTWPKRPPDNLKRRLDELIALLPAQATELVKGLRSTDLFVGQTQATDPVALVQIVRNDLAHGNRSYPDRDLEPWNNALEAIATAHMLRLLHCPKGTLSEALTRSASPDGG